MGESLEAPGRRSEKGKFLSMFDGIKTELASALKSKAARAVGKNTGWLMADRICRLFVTLLMTALIARHLGPREFGALNYAMAFVALFLPLATFGLDRIVVRDYVNGKPGKETILGTTLCWRVCGGALILVIASFVCGLVRPGDRAAQVLVGILSLSPILQAGEVIDFWFQSRLESKYVAIAKTISLAGSTAIRCALLYHDASVYSFAWASLVESLLLSGALIIEFRRRAPDCGRWRFSPAYARTLFFQCWPMALNLALHMLYMRIAIFMLASLKGDTALGLFTAPSRLYDSIVPFFGLLGTSLFPELVKLYSVDNVKFFGRYHQICRLLSLIGWAMFLILAAISPFVIPLMYGSNFASSGIVLSILSAGLLFQLSGMPRAAYLTIINKQGTLLWVSIASIAISCPLNWFLIMRYGIAGAAMATVLATFFNFFLANFIFPATRPLAWIQLKALLLLKH